MINKKQTPKTTHVECSLFSYINHPKELETYLYGLFGNQPTHFSEFISIYIKTITSTSNQGNSYSQFNLGQCYEFERGVEVDYKKAFELYDKSAKQGNLYSEYNLGLFYQSGKEVKQNF